MKEVGRGGGEDSIRREGGEGVENEVDERKDNKIGGVV